MNNADGGDQGPNRLGPHRGGGPNMGGGPMSREERMQRSQEVCKVLNFCFKQDCKIQICKFEIYFVGQTDR